jgi:hypothetical protein
VRRCSPMQRPQCELAKFSMLAHSLSRPKHAHYRDYTRKKSCDFKAKQVIFSHCAKCSLSRCRQSGVFSVPPVRIMTR